jgi:serine phosphatase RsbU (regulator of sigma subunit)
MAIDKNGTYWLALRKELYRYNPTTGENVRIGPNFGLQAGSFLPYNTEQDNKGRILFKSEFGFLRIDPAMINIPNRKPIVSLSSLVINEDTIHGDEFDLFTKGNYTLAWDENFLALEFHTNQVYTPSAHRFFYRLKGVSNNWQDNGISNRIRYTNLSHGSYVLEVKAVNAYSVTSKILRIPFTIQRPFWLAWWFYVLLVLLTGILIFIYIKIRERAYIKQQQILEAKIEERTAEVVAKAREIQMQKDIIEEKNKELTDSIYYAQRIQQSVLPDENTISKNLPSHFIFFRPKDIVSGDFYWFTKQKDSILWAVVDCTGHGVPGGFMSMLGSGLLNQIVNEEQKLEPDEILNHLRDRVMIALKQTGADGESRDGMDISLCRYIISENKLQYAGANNSLYMVRNNELKEVKADKQPIGIYIGEKKPFTRHELKINKGDLLYMSSDGYADQFGGQKGKKFKSSSFEKLLSHISPFDLKEQYNAIESTFMSWKGDYEQLDDVCVIGVKL